MCSRSCSFPILTPSVPRSTAIPNTRPSMSVTTGGERGLTSWVPSSATTTTNRICQLMAASRSRRLGAFDRRELNNLARGQLEFALAAAVLEILHQLHDPEHVGIAGERRGVDGQREIDLVVEKFGDLGQAEADAHLRGWRDANRGAPDLGHWHYPRHQMEIAPR